MIDERKLKSIKRVSQVIAALSIAAFFALMGYSAYKLYSLNRDIADAKDNLSKINAQREQLVIDIEAKKKEIKELDDKTKTLGEITDKIANTDRKIVAQAVNEVIQSSPKAARALPRIYIQIANAYQHFRAKQIATKLQENGFIVPGIENVGDKASSSTVVKYFHKNDEEADEAKKIVEILRGEKITVEAKYFDSSNNIPARRYELWLSADFSPPRPKDVQPKPVKQTEIKPRGVRK